MKIKFEGDKNDVVQLFVVEWVIWILIFVLFMFQTQGQMMEQAEEGNEEDDNLEDPEFEASEKFIYLWMGMIVVK